MSDRDGEARPGDNLQMDFEDELQSQPVEEKRIVMPKKADVSHSDQARKLRSSRGSSARPDPTGPGSADLPAAPLVKTTGAARRSLAQAHPIAERGRDELAHEVEEPSAAPVHLGTAHPLSRIRREGGGRSPARPFGLGGLGRVGSRAVSTGERWARRRGRFGRPNVRSLFGYAGLTATFGIVTALIVTLPSQPVTPAPTGSVYGLSWHVTGQPPVTRLDFGPYFTTLDQDLLMVGTVNTTTNNQVTSTTTVWSTTDGAAWTQMSSEGSFVVSGHRFVAQGLSDDGVGGLVVVGNSLGSAPTDVVATAWHSRDGVNWTPMAVDSGSGQEMVAGAASRSGAVVAAGNSVAWLSTDGKTWSAQLLPGASTAAGSFTPRAVGSWSGGFVIIGLWNGDGPVRSAAWYSPDGREWKMAKTPLTGFDTRGVASVKGTIVAAGNDLGDTAPGLAAVWSSTDGDTWTKSTPPSDQSNVGIDGVASVGDSLLAFGAPPPSTTPATASAAPTLPGSTPVPTAMEMFWVSDNGLDWLPINSTAAPLSRAHMAAIGSRVIMLGGSADGLGIASGDLVLGPARPPASPSAPPANFALSLRVGNSPLIADITSDFALGPVTTSRDRFLLFATGPKGTSIFSSPDGSLWSEETTSSGLTKSGVTGRPVVLKAIPDGEGGIVAIGKVTNSSGDNGMIWHMTQSGTWNQVQFLDDTPPEFSSITAGPGGFVVSSDKAGGSQIMYSIDGGDTWQAGSIAVGEGFALTVATYRFGYVAVGTDPARQGATTAWTSADGRTWTIRTDWHLPPKVTALFGLGNTLVAAAATAPPASPDSSASPSGSGGALSSAGASGSPAASSKATPVPTAKPSATPVPAPTTTTWWWSSTGVVWQELGLISSGGNFAITGDQLLVFDAPTTPTANWTAWTSADGKSWRRPSADPVSFAASKSCEIASLSGRIVIVGWEAPGNLKDYLGKLATE